MDQQSPAEHRHERQGIPRALRLAVLVTMLVALMTGAGVLLASRLARSDSGPGVLDPAAFVAQQPANSTGGGVAPAVDQQAPDFTLKTLDGGEVTLSSLQGKPVLMNFWASWCAPCRVEMPDLVRVYEAHKADGLVVLAINMTFQDSVSDVQAFVKEFNMTFPVLLDETGAVAHNQYRLRGLPMSFFVNRKGIIVRRHIGAMRGEQIDQFVGELLQ